MLEILQDILIILLAGYMTWDNGSGVQVIGAWPVCTGFVMGLITGDWHTSLFIGGTLQLMSLGVTALGGASIPEYGVATIVSIFIATRTGVSTGEAVAVGLPVGMLTLQLDVFVKYVNTFFAHWEQKSLYLIGIHLEFKVCDSCYCSSYLWCPSCKSCDKSNSSMVYNRT